MFIAIGKVFKFLAYVAAAIVLVPLMLYGFLLIAWEDYIKPYCRDRLWW